MQNMRIMSQSAPAGKHGSRRPGCPIPCQYTSAVIENDKTLLNITFLTACWWCPTPCKSAQLFAKRCCLIDCFKVTGVRFCSTEGSSWWSSFLFSGIKILILETPLILASRSPNSRHAQKSCLPDRRWNRRRRRAQRWEGRIAEALVYENTARLQIPCTRAAVRKDHRTPPLGPRPAPAHCGTPALQLLHKEATYPIRLVAVHPLLVEAREEVQDDLDLRSGGGKVVGDRGRAWEASYQSAQRGCVHICEASPIQPLAWKRACLERI